MADDNPKIPGRDQFDIDALVDDYRHRIENLYRRAYLQGKIDQVDATLARLSRDKDTEPPDEFNREAA